ncbi:DUF2972 domain-containing protein [Campylobacter sp. VicNov18]|uniref:DUF2972 domain-containing protein n=1 Tax=Campylobacter bilis TaxID=2691918 RepID=UPI00130E37DA|nr:DUF2972 domain-containing protein [Campylobacter bilis]MPV63467.1 DUF2972 domain-containing protein [Campylobacter hepaticus]MBM0636966.1 DUF2972 domain-containing protein [Campylobacter bilis]MCC8277678.1 DUF2972 domain-containing protein [Campylobacter bilis]MCC8299287.1 DUF2972 domain-containing protein [Campylobacter bilis]MCC8300587.1 DUF2972 domain-containing protein [Campylobacter bilis]
MQNLLKYIKNNLNHTLARILLQALQNSNNEKFFAFVLENIQIICTWLNSHEFYEKYLMTKHPYPPLINPNFVEIDASKHCAQLAWDLNLPLPKHYKFIYISAHGVGAAAFLRYLHQCCNVTCFPSWVLPHDAKERYCIHHMYLNNDKINQYAINISEINLPYFDKFLSLIDYNSNILCGVRDPIGILKHNWGRDWSKVQRNYPCEFNLTYDWRYYIHFLTHQNHAIKIDFKELQEGVFILDYLLKYFNKNNIHYLDMEEISQTKALNTMNCLAKRFDFTPVHEDSYDLFKIKEFRGYIRYLLPLTFYANPKDLDNMFSLSTPNNKKNPHIYAKSIPILLERTHINSEKINIIKEIIKNDLCNDIGVYIDKKDFEELKHNELLFTSVKNYLHDFLSHIKTTLDEDEAKMMKESDVIDYLRKDKALALRFFNIFEKDFSHLKQCRHDIIASWKYYQEFIKMHKNL